MKIGLVYDAVYPWVKGGGEKHLFELAVALQQRGHEVHCFGMRYWDGGHSMERNGVWLHGVCRARVLYDANGKRRTLPALIFAAGLFWTLLRRRAGKLDIIDSIVFPYFSIFAIALGQLLAGRRTAWLITWLEVWGADYWRRYISPKPLAFIATFIERACAEFGDHHLCISQHQAARLHDLLGVPNERIEVIPRGLHLRDLPTAVPERSRLLYIGRLLDYKNVEVVIRALPLVLERLPATRFRIVGSGPQLPALRALADELEVASAVDFVPPKSEANEALQEIATAAILVQPSTREGQSLVVLEAQALRRPVIAAFHHESAVSDFIAHGSNGILIANWDQPAAWAEAIIRVLSDSEVAAQLGIAGNESAQRFDWQSSIVPQVEALYEKLRAG